MVNWFSTIMPTPFNGEKNAGKTGYPNEKKNKVGPLLYREKLTKKSKT